MTSVTRSKKNPLWRNLICYYFYILLYTWTIVAFLMTMRLSQKTQVFKIKFIIFIYQGHIRTIGRRLFFVSLQSNLFLNTFQRDFKVRNAFFISWKKRSPSQLSSFAKCKKGKQLPLLLRLRLVCSWALAQSRKESSWGLLGRSSLLAVISHIICAPP